MLTASGILYKYTSIHLTMPKSGTAFEHVQSGLKKQGGKWFISIEPLIDAQIINKKKPITRKYPNFKNSNVS